MELVSVNNLGFKSTKKIKIEGNDLYINSSKVSSERYLALHSPLQKLISWKKTVTNNPKPCAAGNYAFSRAVSDPKNKKHDNNYMVSGCVGSVDFAELSKLYTELN